MKRGVLFVALALAAPLATVVSSEGGPRSAEASVAVAASLEELVQYASRVVIVTEGERVSRVEDTRYGRGIVTYTKVTVERALKGPAVSELWVRTLGGIVGGRGEIVHGEAQLGPGGRSLLFLTDVGGVTEVTALAQGHYPIVVDEKTGAERLTQSPEAGVLLSRRGPVITAAERLRNVTLGDAIARVSEIVARSQ